MIIQVLIKTPALISRVPHHYLKAKNSLKISIMTVSHIKLTKVLQLWGIPVVLTCFRWHNNFIIKKRKISNCHKTYHLIITLDQFLLKISWDLKLFAQLRSKLRKIPRLRRIRIGFCLEKSFPQYFWRLMTV